jgi:hypothetical protein
VGEIMKLFLKLFVIACLSTIVFGVFFGIFIVVENYYNISLLSNLAGGFIYGSLLSFPIYLTIGIVFSYLIIWITKKVDPTKPYFFGFLMYSLLGFTTAAILLFIFRFGIFDFFDTIFFLGVGVLAFNIYYHFLFFIDVKLLHGRRI